MAQGLVAANFYPTVFYFLEQSQQAVQAVQPIAKSSYTTVDF